MGEDLSMERLRFRGVQLDLARQKESLAFIKGFIDFIARYGYNLLVLYLEGRIKTNSFPYLSNAESYQPDEIRKIVEYAKRKGIEVMPVISNLSHTEMFLQASQLQHLAELRGEKPGRFTLPKQKPFLNLFCPSMKGTYDFFEAYYAEIAEIFPFDYFHVGNDEAWDLGFCDLCRARAESEQGQDGIFATHLLKTHEFITGKLGKKMVMWDDMFEHYPVALEEIPKDIVLCCWQYDNRIELPKGHFSGQARADYFSRYEKLGFEYLIAPGARNLRNIEEFTSYAAKYKPLGGIITSWEKQESFLFENYPVIGTAGVFWSSTQLSMEAAQRQYGQELLGNSESDLDSALGIIEKLNFLGLKVDIRSFYLNPVTFAINDRVQLNKILCNKLLAQMECNGRIESGNILTDISVRLREEKVRLKLLSLIPEVYGRVNKLYYGDPQELVTEIEGALIEVRSLKNIRLQQWKQHREDFSSTKMEERWGSLESNIVALSRIASGVVNENTGLLIVHYFLPDMFAAPVINLQVEYEGACEWEDVACGIYKPIILGDARDNNPYFSVAYTIDSARPVAKCRIQSWSYGRQGITFVEAVNKGGHFTPERIINGEGEVENPEDLMVDDLRWCFLGYKDTNIVFDNPCLAKVKHMLVLGLKKY